MSMFQMMSTVLCVCLKEEKTVTNTHGQVKTTITQSRSLDTGKDSLKFNELSTDK